MRHFGLLSKIIFGFTFNAHIFFCIHILEHIGPRNIKTTLYLKTSIFVYIAICQSFFVVLVCDYFTKNKKTCLSVLF